MNARMYADQKTGEPRNTHSFQRCLKRAWASRPNVVWAFEPVPLEGKKQPRDRTEFMNTPPKKSAVGHQKNVAANPSNAARQLSHLRMEKRFGSVDPHDGGGSTSHAGQ